MIPIAEQFVEKIDPNNITRTYDDVAYKNLLDNQLSWCNSHKDKILAQAKKLYNTITLGTKRDGLRERCCNFKKLEKVLDDYLSHKFKSNQQSRVSPFSRNMIKDNAKKISEKSAALQSLQHKKKEHDL